MKSYAKFMHFHSRKSIWKCRLSNGVHFVMASIGLLLRYNVFRIIIQSWHHRCVWFAVVSTTLSGNIQCGQNTSVNIEANDLHKLLSWIYLNISSIFGMGIRGSCSAICFVICHAWYHYQVARQAKPHIKSIIPWGFMSYAGIIVNQRR